MSLQALSPLVTQAAWDALTMLPVLFVLYAALELLSHQEGSRLMRWSSAPGKLGPIAGAVLGIIPQCGMSVFVTSLFLAGRVTTGTLIATYLATSDEAIPVLLAHRQGLRSVLQLVGIKLAIGAVCGVLIDVVMGSPRHAAGASAARHSWIQAHVETEMHAAPWSRALAHSFRRTVEIVGWVFVVSVAIGGAVQAVGLDRIATSARRHPALEIVGAAMFGLIPNCSASVAIAEGYMRGVLSFAGAVAGLSAGAGYGPILLFRRGLLGTAGRILALCFGFALASGALVAALTL
jgi:hypothetical protein